jgi:hypothetical protein
LHTGQSRNTPQRPIKALAIKQRGGSQRVAATMARQPTSRPVNSIITANRPDVKNI